ncbi:MAG: deoxyribose-phosphate aldolase [bacterium]|nr:deoxyribose-phosphate aldolase [bacterium]
MTLILNSFKDIKKTLKDLYYPVDSKMLNERIEILSKRSIKKDSKIKGLKILISCMDLTTLEGKDTPSKVKMLCEKAKRPHSDPDIPSVAAVCVYPSLVKVAKDSLKNTNIKVATVATYFPSSQTSLDVKLKDTEYSLKQGADEVDIVINRNAFLSGKYDIVYDEIAKAKELCLSYNAKLKVILETGELATYDQVKKASLLAILSGADFIKTSTGKISPAATLQDFLVMLYAIKDYYYYTGQKIGIKPAGGIKTAKEALKYLVVLNETLGDYFITPTLFRIGASSLLNDILMQIIKEKTGRYQNEDYFSKD